MPWKGMIVYMKKEKIILSILALTISLISLSGCKENTNNQEEIKNENIISNDINQESKDIYNNGGSFVSYKGKTYYREYNNASIEKVALYGDFYYETENITSKYINVILENGRIENVFKDEGYGDFYISNDRFFFRGVQNKLYSVNMKGEDYKEICKGYYLRCDEQNDEIYYINIQDNNSMYKINTQNLKISKVAEEIVGTPYFYEDKIYYFESDEEQDTKILEYNMTAKTTQEIATIKHNEKPDDVYYYVASNVMYQNKMFISIGYDAGTANIYSGSQLYCVNLETKEVKLLDNNITRELVREGNLLYYREEQLEEVGNIVKKLNMDSLTISEIKDIGDIVIDSNVIGEKNGNSMYIDGIHLTDKIIFSATEKEEFKNKYAPNALEEDILIQIREVEKVDDKIYFLLEIARHKVEEDIGWRYSYERIASEKYSYDIKTGKKTLIYLYKVTDKILGENTESMSGNELEPLGENEMYLQIRLTDKGLKDTFDIRVEEVGGLIIGKRIEYEGTHSRAEEMLTIKVTREVGAMLSVYIDDKLDSQMLIEAE